MNNLFSTDGRIASTHAPGRVNLIGEHTDYNDGYVLPLAIPQETSVKMQLRDDGKVRASSLNLANSLETYKIGEEKKQDRWLDYIQGVSWYLSNHEKGFRGFDVQIDSRVPMGAGVSSSAALLVALFRAARDLMFLTMDDVEIAKASQYVENHFVGAHVGIMDQMASSLADRTTALFLDTRDLRYERVPLPTDKLEIFVIDSGIKHSHASGAYNTRRRECEEAARLLGVRALRDCTDPEATQKLPEDIRKRARHVITENERVLRSVQALKAGDTKALGELMVASHDSMRDDFQVSTVDIDSLVLTAVKHKEVFGARMTGGGFGGSIVGIAKPGTARDVAYRIAEEAASVIRLTPTVLVPV